MREAGQPVIDEALVRELVAAQFPSWSRLPVQAVGQASWCNRVFRLGKRKVVRLPWLGAYAQQVDKEHRWLPRLAGALPLAVPQALALGQPAAGYPWRWSVLRWIDGDAARPPAIADRVEFARELAAFLLALQRIDATGGPAAGEHSFFRGGPLAAYDTQARQAMALLAGRIDIPTASGLWAQALAGRWSAPPVWVHGDMSLGNLLLRNGRLAAVIDFGNLAIGDPACDLAPAWTLFSGASRQAFRAALPLDEATWARGRGWVLWKAMILAAGLATSNAVEAAEPWRIIDDVLEDHRRCGFMRAPGDERVP